MSLCWWCKYIEKAGQRAFIALSSASGNGVCPSHLVLNHAPPRSGVETLPLYSCRRRSLPAGGFKGAALWAERAELRSNSGLAVVGAWVPARERSGGQVEMGGREGATARVSRRLWNGCGPAAPLSFVGTGENGEQA